VHEDKGYTPLKLNDQIVEDDATITQEDLNTCKTKILHGKLPDFLQENYMDKGSSQLWLSTGYIYPEMEGFVVAIQDWVIKTRNNEKHSLRVDVIDRCRKCDKVHETTAPVIAGCSSLSKSANLSRHEQLAKIIHQQTAIKYTLLERNIPPYYRHKPELVLDSANMLV
jgi:hypothetical protein